jgi:hypothetical protein
MLKNYILLLVLLFTFSVSAQGDLPNNRLTPGSYYNYITMIDVCHKGYIKHKQISWETKKTVLDRYGIPTEQSTSYYIDKLIPESLGGTDSLNNLWPQKFKSKWNCDTKGKLEEKLVKQTCDAIIDLQMARYEISANWIRAYKKYVEDK